ncbi:hypothetical protein AMJ40_06430 [candidate division TA06 bacterium DG_26]|uniref:Uncharacterized protein n=1 Tax=candidate division TA06 bacterium DG_26 TaxID=1703771 RepID=A0A0S7WFU2_UNCT6|nr:MAG: hypothetical protein AMJ40_06430 [candidate division TA06 bacterium DG_26]
MIDNWWSYRFKIDWSGKIEEVKWWVDIAIFDSVVRDILTQVHDKIRFWKIHRRAHDDDKGHVFTFLTCCEDELYESMDRMIRESAMHHKLEQEGLIIKYSSSEADPREIAEPYWPPEIQDSWSHYVMGASEMLLELVDSIKKRKAHLEPCASIQEIERYYVNLDTNLGQLWCNYGAHAFLHHLNALFRYVPVLVKF